MRATAILTAAILGALFTASVLIACPFMAVSHSAGGPCCPGQPVAPKCPLAPTLQTCPYYLTESKIGIAQPGVQVYVPLVAVATVRLPELFGVRELWLNASGIPIRADSDLYLRNRVLLI